MLLLLAAVALGIWLLATGGVRVMTRYEHTPRSRAVFRGLVPFGVLAGYWVTVRYFPGLEDTPYFWLVVVLFFLPCYTLLAIVLAEAWRYTLQLEYERKIYTLQEEELRLEEEMEALRRAGRGEPVRREDAERREAPSSGARELRDRVERWKLQGGSVRVRTMKVEGWEREIRKSTREELVALARELEKSLGQDGDDAQAHLDLVRSYLASEEPREAPGNGRTAQEAAGQDALLYQQLAGTRRELAMWRQKKEDFLKSKITLA
jgi:hypothetical protein